MADPSRLTSAEFQAISHSRPAELDRVSVRFDVRDDEGQTVPAGSTGTVVAVWNDGEAYDVEFTEPRAALATVEPNAIGMIESRHR